MSVFGKILRGLVRVAPAGGRSRASRKLRGIAAVKKKNLKELKSLKKEMIELVGPSKSAEFKAMNSEVSRVIKASSPSIASLKQRYGTKQYRKGPTSETISMIRLEDAKGSLDSLPAGWGRAERLDKRAAEAKRNVRIQRNKAAKLYDDPALDIIRGEFDYYKTRYGGPPLFSKSEAMSPLEVMDFFRPELALEKYGQTLFNIKHYMTTELQVFRQLSSFGGAGRAHGLDKSPARMSARLQRMKRRLVKKKLKQAAVAGAGAYMVTREKH
jgi:hypothetical protein